MQSMFTVTDEGYKMRIRRLPLIILGGIGASTGAVLASNGWDINSIGAVRFGRAATTVSH